MTIQEKLEDLRRFIHDFIYYMDSELYVKINVILIHYAIIPQAKSYSALNTLKKALKKNNDYLQYKKLIVNLENTIYSDIKSTSPKKIRELLKKLPISEEAKLLSDNQLEISITPYLNDNKRIYRLIDNFLNAKSVAYYIGTKNIVKTFLCASPVPCMYGLGYYKWTAPIMNKFIKLYFNSFQRGIEHALQQEYSYSRNGFTKLLNFYNSPKESLTFYYLYYKQIIFQDKKDTQRADRQYDQHFAMYIIDLDASIKKYRAITTPLISKHGEYPNLEYFFETAYKRIKSSQESENTTPVFFLNTKALDEYIHHYSKNLQSLPKYQFIFFKNKKKLCTSMSQLNIPSNNCSSISYFSDIFEEIFKIESLIENKLAQINCDKYTSETIQSYMRLISDIWKTSLDSLYNIEQTD